VDKGIGRLSVDELSPKPGSSLERRLSQRFVSANIDKTLLGQQPKSVSVRSDPCENNIKAKPDNSLRMQQPRVQAAAG